MLGTGNGPVGTRFSLILGTRLAILGTRIGSLKHLKKNDYSKKQYQLSLHYIFNEQGKV